jgi:endonuclease V-like protein UPF0215 family
MLSFGDFIKTVVLKLVACKARVTLMSDVATFNTVTVSFDFTKVTSPVIQAKKEEGRQLQIIITVVRFKPCV